MKKLISSIIKERDYKKKDTESSAASEPTKPTRETILPFPYEYVPYPPQPYRNLPYDAEYITDPFDGIPQRKSVSRGSGGSESYNRPQGGSGPNQRTQGRSVGFGSYPGSPGTNGGPYPEAPSVYGPPPVYAPPVGLPYPGSLPPGYFHGGFQPDFRQGIPHGPPLGDFPPWEPQGGFPAGYFEGIFPLDYAPNFPPSYPYDFPPGVPQGVLPPNLPQGAGPLGYSPSWNPREEHPGSGITLPNKPM